MTVSEYRDLTGAVRDAIANLVSRKTSHDQRVGAGRLRAIVAACREAKCKHAASGARKDRAQVLEAAETLLQKKEREFKEADAALARMAFNGSGY